MATFEQRESGYWQAKVRKKGYPPQSKTFRTKTEAQEWAKQVEASIYRGEYKDTRTAANTTLKQVLEYYRDNNIQKNKGEAVDRLRIDLLLRTELARYSMSALGHDVIEAWCNKYIRENKVKGSTVNRYLNLLSAAINVGIKKMKLNIENPVKQVERPANPEHRDRRLFGEEERRLIDALSVSERIGGRFTGPQNIWLRPLVEFALETAMRRSELLGLEWQYVDKSRRIAHIPDTKIGKGEEAPVSRDVPLSKRALEILEALPRDIGGKVFPISADAVKKAFTRAVERARKVYEVECSEAEETPLAKMLVDLHFHDLRHEATSRLAKVYDIRQLAKVGGWRDLNTLARYYNPTAEELVERMQQHEVAGFDKMTESGKLTLVSNNSKENQ